MLLLLLLVSIDANMIVLRLSSFDTVLLPSLFRIHVHVIDLDLNLVLVKLIASCY